ncbi:MAG: protein kinase family protein [Alphaproteobacteria bacterium]|nr:protein kinase family protein [Alphaproteobacteria bacterium]
MAYPLITDYTNAVRNAHSRFTTLNLAPLLDDRGAPLLYAGNFAAVYKAVNRNTGQVIAVKCFMRELPELMARYKAISATLNRSNASMFQKFSFLENEVFVHSTTAGNGEYPVMVMPWIEGRSLGEVIKKLCLAKKQKGLASLTRVWARLCQELLSLGIAHGDLKHDNVLAAPDATLKLIDYDSVYVPALKGLPSPVLGGTNYQHPKRAKKHFNAQIDHFSMLVILLSLRSLTLNPSLYAQCNNGENIIFTGADFAAPRRSALFSTLAALRDPFVADWSKRLLSSLASETITVPNLEQALRQAEKVT